MSFERFRAGRCSFCRQPPDDHRELAGLPRRPWRICPECVEVGRDIIAQAAKDAASPSSAPTDPEQMLSEMVARGVPADIIERVRENIALASMTPEQRRAVLAKRPPPAPYACSFCDAPRRQVLNLISGADRTFICDRCVEAAAGALA